jgi:uncharacterized Rmd1/YagE family protein
VVLFDVAALEEAAFLAQLETLVTQPYVLRETETVEIRVEAESQEGLEGDVMLLHNADVPRLQLVADILAKSVVLAYYESQVGQNFDRIEPLAVDLQRRGSAGRSAKDVLRHIGGTLLSEHNMVGRVEVTDKPDLLWERADLERLFQRLEGSYEIRERHTAIERKLDLIARTAQTVLDLVQNQHSMRLEWYVVILIVCEIFLTLYEMFVHRR